MSNLHPTASAATDKPVGQEQAGVHPSAVGPEPKTQATRTGESTEQSQNQNQNQNQAPTQNPDQNQEGQQNPPQDGQENQQGGGDNTEQLDKDGYPPQRHAGKVGLGPEFGVQKGEKKDGIGAKITGFKEQMKGKILRKPELVEKGHERVTGEFQQKEKEKEEKDDPFANAGGEDKKDEGDDSKPEEGDDSKPEEGDDSKLEKPKSTAPSHTTEGDKAAKEQAATTHPEGTEAGHEQAAQGQNMEREAGKVVDSK